MRLAPSENGVYKKYTCQLTNTRVLFIDRKSKELNKNKIAAELTRASNGDSPHINGNNSNSTLNGLASFVAIEFSDVAEIRSLHPTKKHHLAQLRLNDGQIYYLKVRDQYWINSLRDLVEKVRVHRRKFTENLGKISLYSPQCITVIVHLFMLPLPLDVIFYNPKIN